MQPFMILASGRCGSTFLRLWLNKHPQIRCHGEVFLNHYGAKDGLRNFCQSSQFYLMLLKLHNNKVLRRINIFQNNRLSNSLVKKFLKSLYFNPEHSGPWVDTSNWDDYQPRDNSINDEFVGFKIVYIDFIRFGCIANEVKRSNTKIVLLHRENLLRQEVSQLTSKARKLAHSTVDVSQVKVALDVKTLLSTFKKNEQELQNIKLQLPPNQYLQLSYEDLFSDITGSRRMILNFLGAKDYEMEMPKLVKLNKAALNDIITNYEQVQKIVMASKYKHFLDQEIV